MHDEQPDEIQGQMKKEPWQSGRGNMFCLETGKNPEWCKVVKICVQHVISVSYMSLHLLEILTNWRGTRSTKGNL